MVIKAQWTHVGFPNMTNGNTYTILYENTAGAYVVDDTSALFLAPNVSAPYWTIVSISDIGAVQIYP